MTPTESQVQSAYTIAKERFAALGVDTEAALKQIEKVAISLHCWQGDDVGGFENPDGDLSGGIAVTGLCVYQSVRHRLTLVDIRFHQAILHFPFFGYLFNHAIF